VLRKIETYNKSQKNNFNSIKSSHLKKIELFIFNILMQGGVAGKNLNPSPKTFLIITALINIF